MLPLLADEVAAAMQMMPGMVTWLGCLSCCLALWLFGCLAASPIDIKLLRFGQFEHAQAQKQDSKQGKPNAIADRLLDQCSRLGQLAHSPTARQHGQHRQTTQLWQSQLQLQL